MRQGVNYGSGDISEEEVTGNTQRARCRQTFGKCGKPVTETAAVCPRCNLGIRRRNVDIDATTFAMRRLGMVDIGEF
jgi:hypothetical protein